MNNISSKGSDEERLIKELLELDLEFYQKVKSRADKLGLTIPQFISQVLSDYFIKLEEKGEVEQDIKVVQFKPNSSNETQKEQETDSSNLRSSGVVDITDKLFTRAEENFADAIGTSDEEQCRQDFRRQLQKQLRKEHDLL